MNSSSLPPTIGACPFCNQPFKSAGMLKIHLEKKHPKFQHLPSKRKRAETTTVDAHLDAAQQPTDVTVGGCPFCKQAFKSASGLTNHLEKQHPKLQHLRKRTNRNKGDLDPIEKATDATETVKDAAQPTNDQNFEDELKRLFLDLSDHILQDHAKSPEEQREQINYNGPENSDAGGDPSDTIIPMEDITSFPADREAGKAISTYPFIVQRELMYNFFQPFQNALDYKLARFLYESHVPRARIDEFFKDGLLGQRTDAQRSSSDCSTRFSFRSASTLYRKIDDMAMDPPWKNGFVDFRLAKNTEFWYRDILESLKYLLRRKSFAAHMCWAPVRHFDTQQDRVYTEMNTATWWWDMQVCQYSTFYICEYLAANFRS